MAEEQIKRKRGRPPKNKNNNEQIGQILMTQNDEQNIGDEKEIAKLTLENVQKKWTNLLSKFSGKASYAEVSQAYQASILNNPFVQNDRVKNISSQAYNTEKSEIQKAMVAPQNHEQILREQSMSLNFQNYVYNTLLRLSRDIPCYYWYVTPQYIEKSEMESDKFKKDIRFANKIVDKFNPQLAFKTINMQVQQEGKCSYLVRKSYDYPSNVDFFLLQKLNSDWIKITGFGSKQQYIVSFNMMLFLNPIYDISFYPPYIQEIWEEMKSAGMVTEDKDHGKWKFIPKQPLDSSHILEYTNNNYFYWVQLSQNDCFTFGQDLSTPMCFPETIGLFLDMKELADYRWLMGNLMSKSVTSILTASVPMQKDAKAGSDATTVSPDLIEFYNSVFQSTVANNVLPFFAPFTDYTLHTIDNQPDNMNIVYSRLRDLIATSGNSALLSVSDKPSIAMTKAAQAIAASRAHYLTLQFQQFLNNVINEQFNLKYEYKVTLWGDNYDKEDFKTSKELLLNGVTSMLPRVLSAKNQTLEDMKCINDYIEVLGIKLKEEDNKKDNIKGDSNTEESVEVKTVGRTPIEVDEIENDSTAASIDAGTNVSDIKEFMIEEGHCIRCGKELDENEEEYCEDCLELLEKEDQE